MKKDRIAKIFLWALVIAYGVCCVYLYDKQTFHVEGAPFESDLPSHIKMAVEDHWFYSITAILYGLFYLTPVGNHLTALFLGCVTVGTIGLTVTLFRAIIERAGWECKSESLLLFASILCNIAMPFYIRAAHYQRYIGYQSATVWHNSTYICMKFCGILTLILYLRLEQKYRDGLSVKEWFLMAGAFVLVNAVKPSFFLVFAPVMALYLLADFIKKVPFYRIFLFGLTVVPSLLIVLWQNQVLFGNHTENGIVFRFGYTLTLHGTHTKATLILSIAFPLFVLFLLWKELLRDKWYLFSWLVWGVGLVQVACLAESGDRARDGNFMWGYSFGIFLILVWSVEKVLEQLKRPTGIFQKKYVRYSFAGSAFLILAYQCYCGIVFFVRLCQGITYWM